MRCCRFSWFLALTGSRYVATGTGFPLDEPLDALYTDEGAWDPDPSLFAHSDDLYSTTVEDDIFPWSSDSSTAVFADNPSICIDENQPPSRIRVRSEICPDQSDSGRSGTAVYDPRLPGTVAEQDEIKKQWCPGIAYQGILDIPVCSLYDDISILSSDLTDFDTGKPLSATGLKIVVTASLITSPSSSSCVKNRAYCCQAWLPRIMELASSYGTGYWCAKAMTAQFDLGN